MLAFLLQYCADSNVTRVARYDVRFRGIRQLQHLGAFDCIFEVLKRIILSSPPFKRDALLFQLGQWGGYAGEVPDESAVVVRQT
jgi:hypothetical protein